MKLKNSVIQAFIKGGILAFGFLPSLYFLPVQAAEKISLVYDSLQLSIKVSSLENFAQEGKIDPDLKLYLSRTSREEREKFRETLVKPLKVNPVVLSRFFNSEIGEDILTRVGRAITLPGGRNGKLALRAAIVQAAFEPEGLTLLNILKKFPTNMELQGKVLLGLARTIERIIDGTKAFTEAMAKLSAQEAANQAPTPNFSLMGNLNQPGAFTFHREVFTIKDTARQRSYYVILYSPQGPLREKTPILIISHGLASRPEDFEDTAQYFASHGYVVALPQHPGSDLARAKAFLEGYDKEVFDRNEFIDRPRDITGVIDELERRNSTQFGGKLDVENVGIVGHSFGGYTALAVAGAEIDFDYLKQECERPYSGLNTSLLLQCRALKLPRQTYNFRDPRIKAVIGTNPVNSVIFGQKGLEKISTPIMFIGGNYDPATPAVFEQLRSFMWIPGSDKYLVLAEGQAHVDFSDLDGGITDALGTMPDLTLPEPGLLKSYGLPVARSFLEVYLLNHSEFRAYLTSAYSIYLSQNHPFKFYLITAASEAAMQTEIDRFRARH